MVLDFSNLKNLEELKAWYKQTRRELVAGMSSPPSDENLDRVKYLEMHLRFSSIYSSRFPEFFSRFRTWRTARLLRKAADYLIQSGRQEYSRLVLSRDSVEEFEEGVALGRIPLSHPISQSLTQRLFAA